MFRRGRFRSDPSVKAEHDLHEDLEPESGSRPGPLRHAISDAANLSVRPRHPRQLGSVGSSSSTRSSWSGRPDSTTGAPDPMGLQVIHEPDCPIGDLVFVHGLGGSAWKSWSWNRDINMFWPDWLPEEDDLFSAFRMSTFGYNANFAGSTTNLNIIDLAKDLLFHLITMCSRQGDARPIIFIVHSMGGLVVKKACALGRHDKQYSAVMSKVRGIVFLATPHRGSQYANVLSNILSATPRDGSFRSFVAGLEMQSSSIQDINESFKQHCDGLLLCSFYETMKTSLGLTKALIVAKDSAVLGYPSEISTAMEADHHTICKYRSRSDPNFQKIKNLLKQWAHQIATKSRTIEVGSVGQLHGLLEKDIRGDVGQRLRDILGVCISDGDLLPSSHETATASGGSGAWLFRKDAFQRWLGQTSDSNSTCTHFWLQGLPGTGKTMVSRSTLDYLMSQGRNVCYHFFNRTHQQHRTIQYCLRSIAFQVALSHSEFAEAILDLHAKTGTVFNASKQRFQSIWELLFEGILFKLSPNTPVFWVLDGIDESDEPSELLSRLSAIQSNTAMKIFLSSRPLKGVSTRDKAQIITYTMRSADTGADMLEYVSTAVKNALPDDESLREFVRSEVLRHSGGSFLWVRLALDVIQDSWHTDADIKSALTEVPAGMTAMYSRMLATIEEQTHRNRNLAKEVLTWVACTWQPLLIDELADALKSEFGAFTNLELTVTQICGHFITLERSDSESLSRRPRASLIHSTARDFLLYGSDDNGPWIESKTAHEKISMACLGYLSNGRWRRHFSSVGASLEHGARKRGNGANGLDEASKDYPLLAYATYYWAYHLSKSPPYSSELMDALETFLANYSLSWMEGLALSGDMSHLIHSAQYLKAYIKKSKHMPSSDSSHVSLSLARSRPSLDWIRPWATDFIRIAGKFAGNMVESPSSVYRNIPPMCPAKTMIAKNFGPKSSSTPVSHLLSVGGLSEETWDDCLASVAIGNDEWINQVLVTETHFFTLSSSSQTIVIWSADTCEKIRTLRGGEYIPMMALDVSGTLLAGCGTTHFFIWETSSGKRVHRIPRTGDAIVRDATFGPHGRELVVAFESCILQTIKLDSGTVTRSEEPNLSSFGAAYQSCPWRQAISPDVAKVALAWRGCSPLVWDVRSGISQQCRVRGPADPLLYPEGLVWQPESGSLLVLCADTSLIEWRVVDDEIVEYPHVKARDIFISKDGSLLLSADSNGTMSIWAFPRLNFIFSLVETRDLITDMVFSPDNQRFYVATGTSCNIWEPDALVRSDDNDLGDTSSAAGSYAATEPIISTLSSTMPTITAMTIGPDDKYFLCGREDGSLIIHDAIEGQRVRKVYTHPAKSAVVSIAWSKSGKYTASCDDAALTVVKRLQLKESGRWAVFPGFEVRLQEAVQQILFSSDEKFLLISTLRKDRVWDVKGKKEVYAITRDTPRWDIHWVTHPTAATTLLCVEACQTKMYEWATGDPISPAADIQQTSNSRAEDQLLRVDKESEAERAISRTPLGQNVTRRVVWSSPIDEGRHQVLAILITDEGLFSTATSHTGAEVHLEPTPTEGTPNLRRSLPSQLGAQVKYFLGTRGNHVVFLRQDGWIMSYDVSPHLSPLEQGMGQSVPSCGSDGNELVGVRRHFYIPKDWLHTVTGHMAVVNDEGTFFCPKQGEVAIVRNGLRL